jgi:hypothetical protein
VTLKVPHRAVICAALDRAKARDLTPLYKAVCPMGLKMPTAFTTVLISAWVVFNLIPLAMMNFSNSSGRLIGT